MKNTYKLFPIAILAVILTISSCKKEIDGCIDSSAMNYSSDATSNDGSCIFAYDIAQGIWSITPDCEEYSIPIIGTTISLNDQLPETINVQGAGNNLLYLEINDTQVNGQIDNIGNIIVAKQTISIEMDGFGEMPIDVEGTGKIESISSGNMNLTYTFDIEVGPLPISESLDCSISLGK